MAHKTILALFLVTCPLELLAQPELPVFFVRGDMDQDGEQNLTDAIFVLNYMFLAEEEPGCMKATDIDDDGVLNLTDVIYFLGYLFLGEIPPLEPFPGCGGDPTPDELDCRSYQRCEFEGLVSAYDKLRTIAGKGSGDNNNEWSPSYEGGPATAAELSRPHFAMGDDAGNLYIADKEAHAVRKVAPDGSIFTVAGTNESGDDGDEPGPGIERRLNSPNGLWVRGDSTVYILDLGNGKIRRLDPSGELTTLITDPDGIPLGRGLWVSEDESLVYYAAGFAIKKWTPDGGIEILAEGFSGLANLIVDPRGNLVATDRVGDRVYRITEDGTAVPIAGNGQASGGGDGELALDTGLDGVRGVWFLPGGGYFLATHEGSQVWYVDTGGYIHLFLDGGKDDSIHFGDGGHFLAPGPKISEARSVSVDVSGNVIVTENDLGYIRMVERRGDEP